MTEDLRNKMIAKARENGDKHGKAAELDFGAGAEWMYEQLELYGVVKSLKDKEEQAFEVWFKINCKKISENEFLYIDTTYTKEHLFQKWKFKDL